MINKNVMRLVSGHLITMIDLSNLMMIKSGPRSINLSRDLAEHEIINWIKLSN